MERVLVTGSAGFIGHHLCRELKRRGYRVVGVDSLVGSNRQYSNCADEFIKKDVNALLPGDFKDIKWVFHLAAIPRVPVSISHPLETHMANVDTALVLMIRAQGAGVKKFIYSSSSSVYGGQDVFPASEKGRTVPLSPYAVQKLAAEHYAEVFRTVYKFPTASLRYFNVFGEEQSANNPYTGVVTRFLELKRQGKPLTIYGDGKQRRDFTYVGDVVEANILAAESGEGVYNVGSGNNYSILEIAKAIGGPIEHRGARLGDPPLSLADNSRMMSLGWKPKIDIVSWLKSQSK